MLNGITLFSPQEEAESARDPYHEIRDTLAVIVKSLDRLTGSNAEFTSKMQSLETRVDAMDERTAAIEHQQKATMAEMSAVRVETAHAHKEDARSLTGPFSAFVTESFVYSPAQIVRFPSTRINVGEHYSTLTSTFTCPIEGIYYFAVNVLTYTDYSPDNSPALYLKRDDEPLVGLFLNMFQDDFVMMMSNSVVTDCSPGQQVYLETVTDVEVAGDSYTTCTFSGFYLDRAV